MAYPGYERIREEITALAAQGWADHQVLEYLARADKTPEEEPILNIAKAIFNSYEPTGNVYFRIKHGVPIFALKPLSGEIEPGVPAQELLGGWCISVRSEELMKEQFGDTPYNELRSEKDKIVILGNGFSPTPLELAERHRVGTLLQPPTVLDRIHYPNFLSDLHAMDYILNSIGLPGLLEMISSLSVIGKLVEAQQAGNLHLVEYVVGSGNPPTVAQDAGLALNIYGPPFRTIGEQLSLLKPGGRLLTSQFPSGYRIIAPCFRFERINQYLARFTREE